jgi:hypothetical protein
VGADYEGGEVHSTGISFSDYARMHTETHGQNASINRNTPAWAINDQQTALVITRLFERSVSRWARGAGTLKQRLEAAQAALERKIPDLVAVIDSLCQRYVEMKMDGGRKKALRQLEIEIEAYDSRVRFIRSGPAYLAAIIHYRYRMGLNSSEIASMLNPVVKASTIRRLLYRMNEIARDIEVGDDVLCENPNKPEAIRLGRAGMRLDEIAEKVSVTSTTVRKWLRSEGIIPPVRHHRAGK